MQSDSIHASIAKMVESRIANETLQQIAESSGLPLALISLHAVPKTPQNVRENVTEQAIASMLRFRISRRESLARISRSSGIRLSLLVQIARANNLRYLHRHPTKMQIKQAIAAVESAGLSCSKAASQVGMSKTSVHRYVQKKRNEYVDTAGEFRVTESHWRCPRHGRIAVTPCVICAAEAARDAYRR